MGDEENTGTTTSPETTEHAVQQEHAAPGAAPVATTGKSSEPQRPSRLIRMGGSMRDSLDIAKVRTLIARLIWLVAVVFALVLAITALLIALDANSDNELVRFFVRFADHVDLGFFDLQNPIKDLNKLESRPGQDVKTALFNYGIGAVVWLAGGRIVERIVRP